MTLNIFSLGGTIALIALPVYLDLIGVYHSLARIYAKVIMPDRST